MIDWGLASKEDIDGAFAAIERMEREGVLHRDRITTARDLLACHTHGCPLDFGAMQTCRIQDLAHDIHGIAQHIDRNTGKLLDCFMPRLARRGP